MSTKTNINYRKFTYFPAAFQQQYTSDSDNSDNNDKNVDEHLKVFFGHFRQQFSSLCERLTYEMWNCSFPIPRTDISGRH